MNLRWVAHNATKEGIEKITNSLLKEIRKQTPQDKVEQVKNNWLALSKLQSTLR
jgi:hypothetical protein